MPGLEARRVGIGERAQNIAGLHRGAVAAGQDAHLGAVGVGGGAGQTAPDIKVICRVMAGVIEPRTIREVADVEGADVDVREFFSRGREFGAQRVGGRLGRHAVGPVIHHLP